MNNDEILQENLTEQQIKDDTSTAENLGKFKDTNSLLKAYKNLESEFTKKSQELKEYKMKEDNVNVITPPSTDILNENLQDNASAPRKPVFESDNWKDKVNDFTSQNNISPETAELLADEILQDENLIYDENCLNKAYIRLLEKENTANSLTDENVERYLNSHPDLKQSLMKSFIVSQNVKVAPTVHSTGGTIAITPPYRPKTFKEAGLAFIEKIKGD